jgi:hypothetical protein
MNKYIERIDNPFNNTEMSHGINKTYPTLPDISIIFRCMHISGYCYYFNYISKYINLFLWNDGWENIWETDGLEIITDMNININDIKKCLFIGYLFIGYIYTDFQKEFIDIHEYCYSYRYNIDKNKFESY